MDISAANSFSTPVLIQAKNDFDISISGTFVATVVLQRSKDGVTNWRDVSTFTAATEQTGSAGSAWFYRLGIKTGGYTSGIATVDIFD